MKKLLLAALIAFSGLAVACGDDDSTPTTTTPPPTPPGTPPPPGTTPPPPTAPPAPPTLGAQIDRMGRPAVNTAGNHSFDATDATKGAAKDEYNQNSDPTTWSKYVPEFEKNLAIIDAIDGTCGNQFFADTTKTDKSRYATLASVLADDRLWVKTDAADCTTYLAVEGNATGKVPNQDCGGRKPGYEVMKITYSAAAAGVLSGVTDGVTPIDAKSNVKTFPYLGPPVQ